MDDEPAPVPELAEEARAFLARLKPMHRRTQEGRGSELRFTLTVPEEMAMLAAWLAFKADREAAGETGPLPRPVCLRREDGRRMRDWNRARDLFLSIIAQELAMDWTMLADASHPMLFPRQSPLAVSPDSVIDDDIPF